MDDLITWIQSGNIERVREYLNVHPWVQGVIVNRVANRVPLLNYAIQRNDVDMVRFLISIGVPLDVSSPGRVTPLSLATINGMVEIVRVLLAAGASPEYTGDSSVTPFARAIIHQHLRVAEVYLEYGANVNFRTDDGNPALMNVICDNDDLSFIKFLVDNGANVHLGTKFGFLPIHSAAYRGLIDTTKYLLEKGACIDAVDGICGESPMHIATANGKSDYIRFLLRETKASVNVVNTHGQTPLDLVTMCGLDRIDDDAIECLLIKGARLRVKSYHSGANRVQRLLAILCLTVRHGLNQTYGIPMDVAKKVTCYLF
jgi:ankyrin repeat protein